MAKKRILIINGPNLNFLGIREPEIYGKQTYDDLVGFCTEEAKARGVEVEIFQSNCEGALVDRIQEAYGNFDGIIINPAAYTHTSIALLDVIRAVGIPTVEVHLTDVSKREKFRQISYVGDACVMTVTGKGFKGYAEAMDVLIKKTLKKNINPQNG